MVRTRFVVFALLPGLMHPVSAADEFDPVASRARAAYRP